MRNIIHMTDDNFCIRASVVDVVHIPQIKEDMQVGPEQAKSYMGCLTALCYLRYLAGKLPLALVSIG